MATCWKSKGPLMVGRWVLHFVCEKRLVRCEICDDRLWEWTCLLLGNDCGVSAGILGGAMRPGCFVQMSESKAMAH